MKSITVNEHMIMISITIYNVAHRCRNLCHSLPRQGTSSAWLVGWLDFDICAQLTIMTSRSSCYDPTCFDTLQVQASSFLAYVHLIRTHFRDNLVCHLDHIRIRARARILLIVFPECFTLKPQGRKKPTLFKICTDLTNILCSLP
ncbi:unnamed protein product [Cyclocybe aegerita]|uniref:Uncharacterized protein n=1 Tax=Cyclocybe aegerita TaxID=1973307 RepID=A0A8S0WEN4_CYCAE|nr:unnamed protein product [Cyclocybe aegerita]